MLLVIDNYDSFTFNLVQRFGEIDPSIDIRVVRNDEHTIDELVAMEPDRVVVSPGPCTPTEAGVSVDAIHRFGGRVPVLGVCLGHQSIGQALGGKVVRAGRLMHGKTDQIYHDGGGLLEGLENPFQATRYHSLVIRPDTLPVALRVTAWTEDPSAEGGVERVIMAVEHRDWPLYGVQFHPESFLTYQGTDLLKRFLEAN
ncbi:Aminodeoxychorismate/anthranilate synthase component 2 [Botrimarina colliarenosi]|uniref:Aminodeoxychorismate/anthranilate synthase component 2 n=1 Tax=Botrimarina colliarenosi TaxID=2528001 RepID=A0A5C6AKX6_9BACT|nr:aminodeoxychorismate/anthranilate synthase component II [Botrimarina colliarenosi]TWU00128.1 Aminodeoxychorismate/anthranilate synthase component 2 [Botrimarina colliarenosi]